MNASASLKHDIYFDLRAHPHIEISGIAVIYGERSIERGPLINLSAGGCFISQIFNIPEGNEVYVVIESTQLRKPVRAKGRIIRIEAGEKLGTAIEFISVDSNSKEEIESLIKENEIEWIIESD